LGDYQTKILKANKLKETTEIPGYTFDKMLYWRIINTHCCEIKRDRKWFKDKFPIFKSVWERIDYLRKDKDAAKIFRDAILAKKEENKEKYANRKNKVILETTINDKIIDSDNSLKNITVSKKSNSWF
jgi:hypothetical protein